MEKDGELLNIKANGGVCLCTGGFEANPDMMSDYTQQPYVYLQAGTTNTGDGISHGPEGRRPAVAHEQRERLVVGLPAPGPLDLQDPARCQRHLRRLQRCPFHGREHLEPPRPHQHRRPLDLRRRCPCPPTTSWTPDRSRTRCAPSSPRATPTRSPAARSISADTIAELSEAIRAIGDAPDFNANGELDEALERYNAHCHANGGEGEKDDFGRQCTIPVETGPFYAIKIGPSMYNTQGGPRHNGLAQVIGLDGLPIEGLFEGGEMGSVFSDMYNGGGNLSETMVFGRFAGQNAAKRAKGEFEGATEKAMTHSEKLAAEAASDVDAAKVDVAAVADGTYEGTGMGYGGKMTVAVTVEGGKIASVEVLENAETPTIGGTALPVYCEQVAAGTDPTDLDVASGASNTLRGFQAAVEDALANA